MNQIEKLPDDYFEALGTPKPHYNFGAIDDYRFYLINNMLAQGSVLDVGVYLGGMLKIAAQNGHEIYGTDVNMARVKLANSLLGNKNVVVQDFRNGDLTNFQNSSIDNVVCMEVLEHVPDNKHALSELCRVARKKVLVTVPFQEDIRYLLCIHCNTYTPLNGHLHSYEFDTITTLTPSGWRVTKTLTFAKRFTRMVSSKLPRSNTSIKILRLIDYIYPGNGHWMLSILQPDSSFL